jgi:hypothetical protein
LCTQLKAEVVALHASDSSRFKQGMVSGGAVSNAGQSDTAVKMGHIRYFTLLHTKCNHTAHQRDDV